MSLTRQASRLWMDEMRVFIVIPTLNEQHHIARVIAGLEKFSLERNAPIIIADGGSTDGTQEIVRAISEQNSLVQLLDNPARLQSAAVNLAVDIYGDGYDFVIRLDAHSEYPEDYCDVLLEEAERTGAASVVTSMVAVGQRGAQKVIASAQNSPFGNGGSAHRNASDGEWVEHGHHALMRIDAFREVGGYDGTFSHNEDAELDYRLIRAGHKIWLTSKTKVLYHPRTTLRSLWRQYFNFGRGRARNIAKHQMRLAKRQLIVAALFPALLLALLVPVSPVFAFPLMLWLTGCLVAGVMISLGSGKAADAAAGFVAGLMHAAWSAGFWYQRIIK